MLKNGYQDPVFYANGEPRRLLVISQQKQTAEYSVLNVSECKTFDQILEQQGRLNGRIAMAPIINNRTVIGDYVVGVCADDVEGHVYVDFCPIKNKLSSALGFYGNILSEL